MKPSIDTLAEAIRNIYARDPESAQDAVEEFLDKELQGVSLSERLAIISLLERMFAPAVSCKPMGAGDELMERLVPLLLGRDVSKDMGTPELLTRLSHSLNTVFTTLNNLIGLINSTLSGGSVPDETIRHIIGTSLEGQGNVQSLEQYLGQIRHAFLVAQKSSQEAARTIAGYILAELDPKAMDQGGGGFRIGPMKKAESFELFEEKYKRVKRWFDSERLALDFLRQFEKNCQKSFSQTGGG